MELSLTPKIALDLATGKPAGNFGPFAYWGTASAAIRNAGAPHDVVDLVDGRYFAWWRGRLVAMYDSATSGLRVDFPAVASRAEELLVHHEVKNDVQRFQ